LQMQPTAPVLLFFPSQLDKPHLVLNNIVSKMNKYLKYTLLFALFVIAVFIIKALLGLGQTPLPSRSSQGILPDTLVSESIPTVGGGEEAKLASAEEPETAAGGSISERLVIKTATLSLLVKNTAAAVEKVKEAATQLSGFVLSSRTYFTDAKKEHLVGEVTIKVPQEKFSEAVKLLKEQALKVESESIQGRDVTEEYTDLESRLRNLEAAETQLLKLIERSGEVSDILEVQREITRVREGIELIKGRMKYLTESAQMSTITAYIATEESELPIVEEGWRPLAVAKKALRSTVAFWQSIGSALIWMAVFGAPLALLVVLLRLLRRRQTPTS